MEVALAAGEVLSFIIAFSIRSCCWKTLQRLEASIALYCPEFDIGENEVLYFIFIIDLNTVN